MKWIKHHYKKLLIAFFTVAIVAFLAIGIPMSPRSYSYKNVTEFTKDGFNEPGDSKKVVAENARFILSIDEKTSYIEVFDKLTGETWLSNPNVQDPKPDITNTALNTQKSTLSYSYYNAAGSVTTQNNYTRSISHPEGVLNPAGHRTFKIKYLDDAVQVLYEIGSIEISHLYFPKYLTAEFMDSIDPEDKSLLERRAYDKFDPERQLYFIDDTKYTDSMTLRVKRDLYSVLYEKYGYTLEQATEENESYGIFLEVDRVYFEIAIQIELLDTGIEVKVLRDSIVEKNGRLGEISIYPYFGTAISIKDGVDTQGYIVLPDGSGAVIQFNNGKITQNTYRKRLYGEDLSLLPYKMSEQQEKISLPLFGMVKENSGFAAIITEGDAQAYINADVSGRVDSYNKVYPSFALREAEAVILGSGFNKYGVTMLTKDIVQTDFTMQYHFLKTEENSYVGIANVFRNYLINDLGLTPSDNTKEAQLVTELIGAFDRKEFFLGIPYKTLDSMTTFSQAQEIIESLKERNISGITVSYLGMSNGGLSNQLFDKNNIPDVLGGTEGFKNFESYLKELNIAFYQQANFVTTKNYSGIIDVNRYTALRVRGKHALYFSYHYPSRLPYSEYDAETDLNQYVINPLYYETLYGKFSNSVHASGLKLEYIGSLLAGHYDYENTLYKEDAKRIQIDFLNIIDEKTLLSNPLMYAVPYASFIEDLPTETTLYALIDYQIPLIHLILSGLVDYSGTSINLTSNRSSQYLFLKSLETGSNLKYTLTYDNSQKLLTTDYNYYMSTYYLNWLDQIESELKIQNDLKIHQGHLVDHVRLQPNVYQVTYSNGLKLMINYNSYDVVVSGVTVRSMNYYVVSEAII